VKGYGDTHARGRGNYEMLMALLPRLREGGNAAARLSELRKAALADETGDALKTALATLPVLDANRLTAN
jgi:indolepyruvate ferredoxin oxidoreductase beta subunit